MSTSVERRLAIAPLPPVKAQPVSMCAPPSPPADPVREIADHLDQIFRASIAKASLGLSPASMAGAYLDWATHFATSPGKQLWLGWKAWRKVLRYGKFLQDCASHGGTAPACITPMPGDHRFDDPAWQLWPFNAYAQGFLLCQQWLHNATTELAGVSAPHERMVEFVSRQLLDIWAPSNFLPTNPVALQRTSQQGGANLARGFKRFIEDLSKQAHAGGHTGPGNPAVGKSVAITPGKVIFRNRLIELIQYSPTTKLIEAEPVLIVPAWIMKYYILDLSAQNSLVRFMVGQGFSVFIISWLNPTEHDRDLGMEDYRKLGVMAAIDAVCAITKAPKLHAAGYCLGGTLLSIAAATMARDNDLRLRSLSLFAAQQDFTEAGELTLFVNAAQVGLLEDMMAEQGYLAPEQMGGAFAMLRSNDLIWSQVIKHYLLGEEDQPTDLMAWNADTTRMPARMHGQYLRHLFLDNDLAEGRYCAAGAPVALSDIRAPIFAVGTTHDHVAPWHSAYKIHLLTDAEITFVLTSGGHNAGIVSEPGHHGRAYQILTRAEDAHYIAPDQWEANARHEDGSWWLAWSLWLQEHSDNKTTPPPMGKPEAGYLIIGDAPGIYVHQN